MKSKLRRVARNGMALAVAGGLLIQCNSQKNQDAIASGNAFVSTENPGYNRCHSRFLVRRISKATEANLDYAAYVQNVMLLDPIEVTVQPEKKVDFVALRFTGLVRDVQSNMSLTSLSVAEKGQLVAWTPALDRLLQWNFGMTAPLADAYSKVTSERWGDTSDVSLPYQEFSELAFHRKGDQYEVWAKLEFKPWMAPFLDGSQDLDQDGFPEAWLLLDSNIFTTEMAQQLLGEYAKQELDSLGVLTWARNLTSRWYPSYNTDIWEMKPGQSWPDPMVPPKVLQELGGYQVASPTVVFRGRPFDDTIFNIFLVGSHPEKKAVTESTLATTVVPKEISGPKSVDTTVPRRTQEIAVALEQQLQSHGTTWAAWENSLAGFRKQVKAFSKREPDNVAGIIGENGFLVFRRELEYLQAPDWQSPSAQHHPLATVVELKNQLAQQGIDFLFIPIPTKLDIYPEMLGAKSNQIPDGIAQPYLRKVLLDLAHEGVETLDLLSPFLKERAVLDGQSQFLFQHEDTHWSELGLRLVARTMAERIRVYPWYANEYVGQKAYSFKDTAYTVLGDIQSRLSDVKKSQVQPESITARQVLQDGKLYEDQEDAPVVILGDSYTGVFQTVGCRHAGVTAQLAAEIKGPVSLVMGWGGGPEAPRKLAKHGPEFLASKRIVIWMMSARDLFAYPGSWKGQ